ncbi:HD domain-containing protein [Patescibacteria group bacterium]|nr:HD domain-containing protein [Patescibacteria group bacterium]MBU1931177.1 HD domain-containing protein [Patescibacteria group bacterium]
MNLDLPEVVLKILTTLTKAGFQAYVVGGAIRDLLMDKELYDWDFTTDAQPEEIIKLFPEAFYDNVFGTVGVTGEHLKKQFKLKDKTTEDEAVFEITTFRSESGYSDRRRPDKVVWGKNLEEDLARRDFTVNAMALKIKNAKLKMQNYQIVDPYEGQEDLKKRLIRAVGNPNTRFSEDGLRMMRAIRIGAQLGFGIEEKTLAAINTNAELIKQIASERIRDEFLKLLVSDYPKQGIMLMSSSGLLQEILPELLAMRGVTQAGHHTKDVWDHSLDSLQECPSRDPIVRLAVLLHDVGKPTVFQRQKGTITFYNHEVVGARMAKKIADRLRLSKKQKELLWLLVRWHMFAYEPKMTDKAIRRFIRRVGRENINQMMMLRIGDRLGGGSKATSWRLRELQERIGQVLYTPMQISDLKISGHDVMKVLKIKSGPKIGQVLEKLFDEVMDDAAKNDREYLLKRIGEIS